MEREYNLKNQPEKYPKEPRDCKDSHCENKNDHKTESKHGTSSQHIKG